MQLRPYHAGDRNALVDLWYESWRSIGLPSPVVTRADLAGRAPDDLARRWTVTLAEADGRLVGFLALVLAETRLDQLFVSPGAQGQGVGLALFNVAVERMPGGFWLSTHPDNRRARAFYERRGMTVEPAETGVTGERVVYVIRPSAPWRGPPAGRFKGAG